MSRPERLTVIDDYGESARTTKRPVTLRVRARVRVRVRCRGRVRGRVRVRVRGRVRVRVRGRGRVGSLYGPLRVAGKVLERSSDCPRWIPVTFGLVKGSLLQGWN